MSTVYKVFITDANAQNPRKFMLGVPTGGFGNRCIVNQSVNHENMTVAGLWYYNLFADNPNQKPPIFDTGTTVLFYNSTTSGAYLGMSEFLAQNMGESAILLQSGTTIIVWLCNSTAQIGATNTRNIVLTRSASSRDITCTFRVGTTTSFTVTCGGYASIFPWVYPNVIYNNVTGCCGGLSLYMYDYDDSVAIPNTQGLPNPAKSFDENVIHWIYGLPDPIDTDNPYSFGGISGPGGGDGNFSDDSDDVEEDSMPSIDAVGTGMATIFSPTKSQLKSLSEVFWGSQWWTALQNTIEGIDKMFVSLGIVPFNVTKGSTVEVTWLGLSITEVMLTLASKQFYEFNMGTIDLSDDSRIFTSGSALDYSPFSKLGIYLPFIGFQDLDIDECRGTTINLKYRIDILSGTCVALIKIGGKTIYQFTGNCVTQIPITSQNFENLFTNAVNVGIAFSTARNAAAVASAGEAATAEMVQTGKMSATGAALDATQRSARVASANASLGNATANAMMGMKPDFNKTGSVSASASLLTVKQPFLYLKTPRQCLPDHYQRYCGFPSNMTGKLSEFSGYTVVEDIRLNGLVATSGEVEEIYDLLKSGVIV